MGLFTLALTNELCIASNENMTKPLLIITDYRCKQIWESYGMFQDNKFAENLNSLP